MPSETIDPRRIGIMDWDIYHAAIAKMKESGFAVDEKTDKQIVDLIISMDKSVPTEASVDVVFDVMTGVITSQKEESLISDINIEIQGRGHQSLTNEEANAILKRYREIDPVVVYHDHKDRVEDHIKWLLHSWRPQRGYEIPGVTPIPENAKLVPAEDREIRVQFKTPEGGPRYSRALTSYCGADAMFVVNGQIIGEAQEINWRQFLKRPYPDGYALHGKVLLTVFNKEPLKHVIQARPEKTTMGIIFANEYGQSSFARFVNPEFVYFEGGIGVDNIIMDTTYHFVADDYIMMEHNDRIYLDNDELNPVFDQ